MINIKTLLSSFDDKGTLMKWLKSVEHALDDATLTSVQVISTSDTTIKLSFVFADGTSIETPTITLPRGEQGETGATGNGIASITKTGTSGLVDTYTITFTNGTTTTFTVTNGEDGQDGQDGATGATGATGNGIASITKTGTSGLVDTYTITFTNGSTTTFTVTNGQNGADGVGIPTGGTTGQVLKKKSNTNYDTEWQSDTAYAIEFVTYGTTTYAEITALLNNGKIPVCYYMDDLYIYNHHALSSYMTPYVFVSIWGIHSYTTTIDSQNTWDTHYTALQANLESTTINEGTIAKNIGFNSQGLLVKQTPQTGMTNPMSTQGDIIYGGIDGTPMALSIGQAERVLSVNSNGNGFTWAIKNIYYSTYKVYNRNTNVEYGRFYLYTSNIIPLTSTQLETMAENDIVPVSVVQDSAQSSVPWVYGIRKINGVMYLLYYTYDTAQNILISDRYSFSNYSFSRVSVNKII